MNTNLINALKFRMDMMKLYCPSLVSSNIYESQPTEFNLYFSEKEYVRCVGIVLTGKNLRGWIRLFSEEQLELDFGEIVFDCGVQYYYTPSELKLKHFVDESLFKDVLFKVFGKNNKKVECDYVHVCFRNEIEFLIYLDKIDCYVSGVLDKVILFEGNNIKDIKATILEYRRKS